METPPQMWFSSTSTIGYMNHYEPIIGIYSMYKKNTDTLDVPYGCYPMTNWDAHDAHGRALFCTIFSWADTWTMGTVHKHQFSALCVLGKQHIVASDSIPINSRDMKTNVGLVANHTTVYASSLSIDTYSFVYIYIHIYICIGTAQIDYVDMICVHQSCHISST